MPQDLMPDKREYAYIVFFDGVCVLCNQSVDFLMKIDRKKRLKFASLQGETAKAQLDDDQRSDLKSMVFFSYNRPITQQSSAVINALMAVGGFWKIVVVFKIIPTFIRDSIYQWIAKHRYRWFGIKDSCRMPVEADQGRILP